MLPTPGALVASRRNALWLDAHPEHRQVPAEGPPPDLSAYRNLPALGAGQRFKPGWAVGGWFVPFMNLWRPKQMVNDIWRTGDPRAPRVLQPSRYEHVRVPRTITAWWLLFILGNLAGRLLWSTSLDTVAHERLFTERDLTSSAIDIVTLVLALWVVRSLTRRQQARARALAAPGLGGLGLERPQP